MNNEWTMNNEFSLAIGSESPFPAPIVEEHNNFNPVKTPKT